MRCHLHSIIPLQVDLQKLETDENLKRSQKHCTAEMSAGIYPPSLKFNITYSYGRVDRYTRKPHVVSLNGCEAGNEVSFLIEVFEPPAYSLGMTLCVICCLGTWCVILFHTCSYML